MLKLASETSAGRTTLEAVSRPECPPSCEVGEDPLGQIGKRVQSDFSHDGRCAHKRKYYDNRMEGRGETFAPLCTVRR